MSEKFFKLLKIGVVVVVVSILLIVFKIASLEAPSLSTWGASRLSTNSGVQSDYYLNGNKIFIRTHSGTGFTKPQDIYLEGVDIESFQPIGSKMAKDKNSVFYYGYKLILDPQTTRILANSIPGEGADYVADKNGVYFIDTNTENPLKPSYSAKLISIYVSEFRPMNGILDYYRTDEYLFKNGEQIISADPDTFKIISNAWAIDSDTIFCGSKSFGYAPLKDIRANINPSELSPHPQSDEYAKISDLILYCPDRQTGPIIVENADIASFEVGFNLVGDLRTDAQDENWYYHKGERVITKNSID